MTCPACETRKTKTYRGVYYVKCSGCKATQSNEARSLHLSNLKTIRTSAQRREYISAVGRREGAESEAKLREEFARWWETK
jgi:recombinational DNA repair protein RecR